MFKRPSGEMAMRGFVAGIDGGWANSARSIGPGTPLTRLVAHWFNLPGHFGRGRLHEDAEGGGWREWSGRWTHRTAGWDITVDARADHDEVWAQACAEHAYVMTHVMEVRRIDGATFTVEQGEELLEALHIAVSFALGRWAAPMLPVGFDNGGTAVWECWRVDFCDPARHVSAGCWYDRDGAALSELIDCILAAFSDPARRAPLSLQMKYAISGVQDRGFLEQRITIAATGIEHLTWQQLVVGNIVAKKDYKSKAWPAARKLREVLAVAGIPADLDAVLLPAAASFATRPNPQGVPQDGAEVVTFVRNRLVHPEGDQASVYGNDGLVQDVWLLTRHYLVLLILHEIGYRGAYRNLTKVDGWASEVGTVPWA